MAVGRGEEATSSSSGDHCCRDEVNSANALAQPLDRMAAELALTTDLAIILVTATLVGIAAYRTGQPTIVGYLLTGLLLGPAAFGVVEPSETTTAMAELGLAFLLFLLGIKLRIEDISHVLSTILKVSFPQMGLVFLVGSGTASILGFPVWEAVLIGAVVMYSSTAVVVKMLTDKDAVTSLPGKLDVGVLLVQDVVVVILLTLLATGRPGGAAELGLTLLTILGLIAGVGVITVVAMRYLLPELFRRVAHDRDAFFLVAVAWAFLFILGFDELGLSIEMGAFLAGVSLAQLPYSTELRDRISPLSDLFILVFFASIGLQLDAGDLFVYWQEAVVAAVVLLPAKFLIFFALFRWQEFSLETAFLGSVNMVQVSEFALVAGAVAVAEGFIGEPVLGFLSLLAVLTMSVSVYVIKYNYRLFERLQPFLRRWETAGTGRLIEQKRYRDHAVVIGYDELTRGILPRLETAYDDVVVVDRTVAHIDALERAGHDVVYGDVRHAEVRNASGLERAAFVLSSSAEPDVNRALIADVGERTTVFVEAEWAEDARELYEYGAHYVVLNPQLTAERLAEYLDAYFEDHEVFDTAAKTDIVRSQRPGPVFESAGDADGGFDE
jgi:Kef-type K+ transport system membrane component KefB